MVISNPNMERSEPLYVVYQLEFLGYDTNHWLPIWKKQPSVKFDISSSL